MSLEIVSAEAAVFSGNVQKLVVEGSDGELGLHPGHTALLTQIKPGQIYASLEDGSDRYFYVSGGMLEVQPAVVTVLAEVFTGVQGKYVSLKDTIRGFKAILDGEYDHLPEQAFYMVGSIEEAVEKAKTL